MNWLWVRENLYEQGSKVIQISSLDYSFGIDFVDLVSTVVRNKAVAYMQFSVPKTKNTG